jgi:tetratricopeptide (TPR) repeat protein
LMETDYYELLGVEPGASPEVVHRAYLELGRKVHPSHAERLGIERWEPALQLLFERATEGYLVLTDSERSREYRAEVHRPAVGPEVGEPTRGTGRAEEVHRVSERNYRLARDLARRGEYHFAVELLHRAVLMDPRSEYYRLLADCQMENPLWLDKAVDNYARAVEGSPKEADHRVALAAACERSGDLERAQAEYREALALLPAHQEALAGLARVQQAARDQRGGSLERLRDWWRRE